MLLLVVLAACGQTEGISQDVYKKIEEGMTQAEVEQIAGAPSEKETNNPYDVWIYKGKDGVKRDSSVRIEFSKEQTVLSKSQKNLFEAPTALEETYTAEGELLSFITEFNELVDLNKDMDFLKPISVENLEKKTTTFYDGQGTIITISDPSMINENNQYTNKIHFEINADGAIKEIYFIGSDTEYSLLSLYALDISEETIDQIIESYKDIDIETLESKSFNFSEGAYEISIKNGMPRVMIINNMNNM